MKTIGIKRDFMHATDEELETQGLKISSSMASSSYFDGITPSIADLADAVQEYVTALANSKGDPTDKAIKDQKKLELQNLLKKLALSVEVMAEGDVVKLASSGFTLTSINYTPKILGIIFRFAVLYGKLSGTVVLKCNGVKNKVNYTAQWALSPVSNDTVWNAKTSSKATCPVDNLEAGKIYCFRMVANGSNDQIVYSEVITKMVV